MYIYIYIYLYKKTNSSMLCINSSNSFSRFCSHLNKIIDIQHTPIKKKSKKQISRKQQSSVTVVIPGTIFFLSFSIIIWKENSLG